MGVPGIFLKQLKAIFYRRFAEFIVLGDQVEEATNHVASACASGRALVRLVSVIGIGELLGFRNVVQ